MPTELSVPDDLDHVALIASGFRSPGISYVLGIATTVILIAQPYTAPPAPAASAAGRALPGDPCGTVHGSAFVLLRARTLLFAEFA